MNSLLKRLQLIIIFKLGHLVMPILCTMLSGINESSYAQVEPRISNINPTGIITNSPLRAGETLLLLGQSGTSYTWTGPNGFSSTLNSVEIPNITSNETGTYYLTVYNSYDNTTTNYSRDVSLKPYNGQCLNVENYTVCLNSYLNMWSSWGAPYDNTWTSTFPGGII